MTTTEKCLAANLTGTETNGVLALEKLGATVEIVHLHDGRTLRTVTVFGDATKNVVKVARMCGVRIERKHVLAPLAFVFFQKKAVQS